MIRIGLMAIVAVVLLQSAPALSAPPLEQLMDLNGKAVAVVTLKSRDNFISEYRYEVMVRNQSADPLIADSLVIVLDKVTNIGGADREALKGELLLDRMEILDQDGTTADGKPYFVVPTGTGPDLLPLNNSQPVSVRIRNKDYLIIFTPSFKVYGLKRPPPEPKHVEPPPAPAPSRNAVDKLIQLLLKKGVITEEEWRKANQP